MRTRHEDQRMVAKTGTERKTIEARFHRQMVERAEALRSRRVGDLDCEMRRQAHLARMAEGRPRWIAIYRDIIHPITGQVIGAKYVQHKLVRRFA